jgi:Glycosyl hydrolases family 16
MFVFHTMALLVSPLLSTALAGYTLSHDYTGQSFFDGFEFFTAPDPTQGHVHFVDKDTANKTGLAGIAHSEFAPNAAYCAADSKNKAPNGRDSTRVQSLQTFNHGLFVADIAHMPDAVCGTWPAFWMVGPDWPNGGEIDIIEGVNEQTVNKMTLHTGAGVVVSKSAAYSGELVTPNCDINAPGQDKNAGCQISDKEENTYGNGFNKIGGGVYVTEWVTKGIKIWFFPRKAIPADIAAGTPTPQENWGAPRATFVGDFKVDDHFKDLKIIFDTTFCGQWAGAAWANSSCASKAPTCQEFVTKNPAAFKEAYWAINSVKVFELPAGSRRRSGGAVLPIMP